jgi:phage gp37-like protein
MIGLVENAMLARIKAACDAKAVPYAYATLENWPKNFDSFLESEVIRYPAAWSAFAGAHRVERVMPGRWRAHCAFGLVVAAQNLRNEVSRRLGGSPSEPGSYQLATDALQLLSDQRLGLDIDSFTPTSIMPVETSDVPKLRQVSIFAVSFDTALYFDCAPILAGIAEFKTFHPNWDPAPFGHVDRADLPDDAAAVAADNIELCLEPA